MEKEILFKEGKYSIQKYKGIPEAAISFLDSIAWGSEGAVFEHKNTEEHIRLLHNPMLLAIHEENEIRATAVFSNTPVFVNGNSYNCYYIRYFASSKAIRGKGVMKHFSVKVMEAIRENESEKTIYFACIEAANKGSYKVVESAGYEDIGTIKTLGFSRFFPKENKNISPINSSKEKAAIIQLLKKQYQRHALVQFNSIFMNDDYYVLRENGEIVVGCQYHRVHWVINKMKGFSGKLIMNIVPLIPIINGLFNPKRFEFLAFEGIYCKPDMEHKLYELFEGLLAKEKLKSSMFWLGKTCPLRTSIMKKGNLGLIHSFIKDSDVFILSSFQNMDTTEIDALKSQPLFASAFDYI